MENMQSRVDAIFDELIETDPSLKERETEIRRIVEKLLRAKPDVEIDRDFREKVLTDILSRDTFAERNRPAAWIGRTAAGVTALAAVLAVVFLVPRYTPLPMDQSAGGDGVEMLDDTTSSALSAPAPEVAMQEKRASSGSGLTGAAPKQESLAMPSASIAGQGAGGEAEVDTAAKVDSEAHVDTEEYDRIYENPFLPVIGNPLSTFSLDIDTASYANVRRFLNQDSLPYTDAVRIEELVNYFDYDYPAPRGPEPFSVHTELSRAPWESDHLLLKIGLKGREIPMSQLPPNNLVFLLDVSGSMNEPNKLPLLKSALKLVVDQLRPVDRIAIAVYAGAAGMVLEPTDGGEKADIMAALDSLEAGGSTAGGAGIELAYSTARQYFDPEGNNRVILATDGDFNVGPSSDDELIRMIERERASGVFLTVLGFGSGNYKDSKMESLADAGNGNYAYIDSIGEARKVLVKELGATLFTIAKDVKIQVEFNPSQVESYRLIGYENRLLAAEDFDDDTKDAGELGAGHTVTALYEIVPVAGRAGFDVENSNDGGGTTEKDGSLTGLRYQDSVLTDASVETNELLSLRLRYKHPDEDTSSLIEAIVTNEPLRLEDTSSDFRFAASVAAWGMLLRDSAHAGEADFDLVIETAEGALAGDPNGYRGEFLELVRISRALKSRE